MDYLLKQSKETSVVAGDELSWRLFGQLEKMIDAALIFLCIATADHPFTLVG
jgi:hypothetical protein